jgi:hypothetical protein
MIPQRWFAPSRLAAIALAPAGIRRGDIVLASFPRSGSTWLRFLIAQLYAIRVPPPEQIDFTTIDRLMPEIARSNLFAPWWAGARPRVLKTHYRSSAWLRRARTLLLVRDPLDTLRSYHRFRSRLRVQPFTRDWTVFLRHARFGLPAWIDHYLSWARAADLTVRYEDLRDERGDALAALVRDLGIEAAPGELALARARCTREEMRRLEQLHGHARGDYYLAGRGFMEPDTGDEAQGAGDMAYARSLCQNRLPPDLRAGFTFGDRYLA